MRNLETLLDNKEIIYDKLEEFGFQNNKKEWIYEEEICDAQFKVVIYISQNKMYSKVIDLFNEEEYLLVDVQDSVGEFVGKVREEYELILQDFLKVCTIPNVFQSKQAQQVIQYVREKYQDELEFLWKKLPEAAIWRNKVNQKWYGVIMKISERKLGLNSDKIVDVIDLRCGKEEQIVDNQKIFPGYHMNKRSWITIKLDGTMKMQEIYERIDISYAINVKF